MSARKSGNPDSGILVCAFNIPLHGLKCLEDPGLFYVSEDVANNETSKSLRVNLLSFLTNRGDKRNGRMSPISLVCISFFGTPNDLHKSLDICQVRNAKNKTPMI